MLLSKNHTLEWQKRLEKRDPMQLFAEKGDFSNEKRPKRDPKRGLGLHKRDPVDSSAYRPPKGTQLIKLLINRIEIPLIGLL